MKDHLKSKLIPLVIYIGIMISGGMIIFAFQKSLLLKSCFLGFFLMITFHIIYFHKIHHAHEKRIKAEKNKIKSLYDTLLEKNQVLELNNEALKVLLEVQKFITFTEDVISNISKISQICNEKLNFKTGIFLLETESDLEMKISPFFEYDEDIQKKLFSTLNPHLWDIMYTEENLLINDFFTTLKVPLEKEVEDYSCYCMPLKVDGNIVGVSTFVFDGSLEGFSELIINLAPLLNQEFENAIKYSRKYIELLEKAEKDELTGLYNYGYFKMKLEALFKESLQKKTSFGLLMIDVDKFKNINDTRGHLFGNKVLKEIADSIKKSVRSKDIACRYGGDEFAVLMPEVNKKNIDDIANRINHSIIKNKDIPQEVGISIGGAVASPSIKSPEELIKIADIALYKAKTSKKNTDAKFVLDVV